jgi:hypothetical protein
MTAVEVCYRFGAAPGEREMAAIDRIWEVYGIRRLQFNEQEHTLRVEYDATRLDEAMVEGLLRHAGLEVVERLTPA